MNKQNPLTAEALKLAILNGMYLPPSPALTLLKRGIVKNYAAAVIEHRRRLDIAKRRNAVRGRVKRLAGAYLESNYNEGAAI
jgi:hypothetical protein